MKRVLSIWLPAWPIDRLRRAARRRTPSSRCRSDGRDETGPLALVLATPRGLRLTAVNDAARRHGLSAGMALADARAQLPALAAHPAEPAADAKALRALAEWCGRYSPWTASDGADGLWLDVSGCAHLFGGERALLDDIAARLTAMGVRRRLGLADTPGAAWAAARFAVAADAGDGGTTIVPPGEGRRALADLPVACLRLGADAVITLRRFGLKTVGQLDALPRPVLRRRFDDADATEAVLRRLDQALGRRDEPLAPLRPAPRCRSRRLFAEPIASAEAIAAALDALLADIGRTLARRHTGARRLVLAACRVDGSVGRVAVSTSRAARDPAHFKRLFDERLAAIDPGFGIDALVLSATATEPLDAAQTSLAPAPGREADIDDAAARLIDRLVNRLGADAVTRCLPRPSHIPERAATHPSALHESAAAPFGDAHRPVARPFRLLARPEAIRVLAEIPEGPPLRFTWRRVVRHVVRAEGPERIAPEWWGDGADEWTRTRDYYRIEDSQGRRYWVFRDGLYQEDAGDGTPRWYLHGFFA